MLCLVCAWDVVRLLIWVLKKRRSSPRCEWHKKRNSVNVAISCILFGYSPQEMNDSIISVFDRDLLRVCVCLYGSVCVWKNQVTQTNLKSIKKMPCCYWRTSGHFYLIDVTISLGNRTHLIPPTEFIVLIFAWLIDLIRRFRKLFKKKVCNAVRFESSRRRNLNSPAIAVVFQTTVCVCAACG